MFVGRAGWGGWAPIVVAVVAVVAVCVPKSENKSSPNTRQTNIRPDTDSDSDSQMLRYKSTIRQIMLSVSGI